MRDTAIEVAKRLLVDSIWKSANLEGLGTTFPKTEAIHSNSLMLLREYNKVIGELLFNYAGEICTIIIDVLEKIEENEDIELRALKYFCYVARTQMFIDGNKRVAQL